jgi:two-component system, cell cycle sensor histidine kinase and response regulator CckA
LQPEVVNLNTLVTDTVGLLQRVIGEDIELVTTLDANLANVRADPAQVQQVILNLSTNARDAMPVGGQLKIETKNARLDAPRSGANGSVGPGEYVVVQVTDQGSGMDPTVVAHIFEPFFTTKKPGKGTGLGLAMVYGIVKQSGGEILVQSQVGEGTVFEIFFPVVGEAVSFQEAANTLTPLPSGSETILFAEDEPGVRALAQAVLSSAGYRVFEAANAREALAISEAHAGRIDLLLTDVVMPGMGGRELADRIAEARPESKIVYMSGHIPDLAMRHGVKAADVAYLEKPFSALGLAQMVRSVLDGAHSDAPVFR